MKNVLIVDNEKSMQEVYRDIFKEQDEYRVEITGDSFKALNILKQRRFDIAILDVILGPVTGDAIYHMIREDEHNAKMPVIFATVLTPNLMNTREFKYVKVVNKPLDPEKLFNAMKDLMTKDDGPIKAKETL